MIGRLNTNKDRAIVVSPKHPYKNKNKNIFEDSFGLLSELLQSSEFKFKLVIFHHKDKDYVTTRDKLIKEGKEVEFDFGRKLFLELNKWRVIDKSSNQLSLNFPLED